MLSPSGCAQDPANGICPHYLQFGQNRHNQKAPCLAGAWSSDGRRFVIGTQSGDFTIWEVCLLALLSVCQYCLLTIFICVCNSPSSYYNCYVLSQGDIFKFERVNTAHTDAIQAISWSRQGRILISGDRAGMIKLFSSQMLNIGHLSGAHEGAVRGLSYSPTETKFVSVGDDKLVKIWDYERCESTMSGHLNEVYILLYHI